MKKLANIPNKRLEETFRQHGIDRQDWEECKRLVIYGASINPELKHRLNHIGNYKVWLGTILAELSKGIKHRFPPPDYKATCSYESLCCKAD